MRSKFAVIFSVFIIVIWAFFQYSSVHAQCFDAAGGPIPCPPGGDGDDKNKNRPTETPIPPTLTLTPQPSDTPTSIQTTPTIAYTPTDLSATATPTPRQTPKPSSPSSTSNDWPIWAVGLVVVIIALILPAVQKAFFTPPSLPSNSYKEWKAIESLLKEEAGKSKTSTSEAEDNR